MVLASWMVGLNERLLPALMDVALRSVVILALAGLAAGAMRRTSAAARHWVWLLGFAGLLLLPAFSISLPGWHVLPRMERAALPAATPAAVVSVSAASSLPLVAESPAPSAETPAMPSAQEAPPERSAAGLASEPLRGAQETGSQVLGKVTPAARSATPAGVPWGLAIVALWLAGGVLVLGHALLGHVSLWRLQRRCTPMRTGHWSEMLDRLRGELQMRQKVQLLSSPLRAMPMTWGLMRARLLLPAHAAEWPPEQCRSVLLHELGHVRRRDCLAQFVVKVACALYWFNPLVWVAWRRMQVERERACDDLVLNHGARPSDYARHLLESATATQTLRFVGAAALAVARVSTLEERMRAILDPRRNRRAMTGLATLCTTLMLLAALLPVAALRAQEALPPTAPTLAPLPPPAPSTVAPRPAFTPAAGGSTTAGPATTGPTARGRGSSRGGTTPWATTAPVLGEGPTCTLDATIYDVRVAADSIGRLDMDALTRASAGAAEFEKALAELGPMRPLYRTNNSIRLASATISIGNQTPYVTNAQQTRGGQTINSVSYAQTGALFSIAGRVGASGSIHMEMDIKLSALSESATAIAENVKAPVMRSSTLSHNGPVIAQKPFIVLSADAASMDDNGRAVVYIARITLGTPYSPPPPE